MPPLTLLGPQRLKPTLVGAFDRLSLDGPVAAITAGWQEREGEDKELAAHLGRKVVNLRLHRRCDRVFADDPELFQAHRARQDRLQEMQRLYRYRLDFTIIPARELLRRKGDRELLEKERQAAIAALRRLDEEHLARIARVHEEFERDHRPLDHRAVRRERRQLARLLAGTSAVAIAGGHVAVLLNRMRLFGIAELIAEKPVFAWSAGAMAIGERVVLFHDSPPWGAGNPEVLEVGLGLFPGLLPLPDARHRLRLDDPARVALLTRRFEPALCVPLDEGASVLWDGERWQPLSQARRLTVAGRVEELEAA